MSRKGEDVYERRDGDCEGRYIRSKPVQTSNIICPFSQLAKEWTDINSLQWKKSSTMKYMNILNNHLLPEFGKQNITDISREDVLIYIGKLHVQGGNKNQGLAPKTINSIISVMKNIFEYAVINKGFSLICFDGLGIKQVQKPMRILSKTEQGKLSKYLMEHQSFTCLGILISLYTGLRVGELCALKWEDVSFEDKYIHVCKTMQRLQKKDSLDYKTEIIISTPKSDCSIRNVPIPDKLLQLMQEYRKPSDTYILTGMTNIYIEPRTMQNRFKAITKKSGIATANFHSLRHTFATRCIELGFDIKCLSEVLGHASVNITLNRYVHPSMDLKQKNMNMLSDLLAVK